MRTRYLVAALVIGAIPLSTIVSADPVPGLYQSTDLGGQVLTGRASTSRTGINSGLPHVLHAQSWDGATLGTQWEVSCAVEATPFGVQDNRNVAGTGTVVYTSQFQGGTLTLFPGGYPWGDGTATLGMTTVISTVQFVSFVPVASVVNANTSGTFSNGCSLVFAIGNGSGVGETTSLNPALTKPATFPTFQDATCAPAGPLAQFGTWGTTLTQTMAIDCGGLPVERSTWSAVKGLRLN
jgi:hypothetical protein